MAPALESGSLARRQNGLNDGDEYCDSYYGCDSTWDTWGRWVALAVIVVVILLLAFGFSCINSRRRRRQGMAPRYGTGWMAPPKYGEPYHGGPPAPPYSPPVNYQQTGNTFNSNDGYYGHHSYGNGQPPIELQPPSSAYQPQRGGDPVYDAPVGPPPGKRDHIIR